MIIKRLVFIFFIIILQGINFYAHIPISLGGDCTVAGVLRTNGLRDAAYPFDWMFSSFNSVYQSIKDDFKMFLDASTLYIGPDRRTVLDFYGNSFVHDFPTIHHNAALDDAESHEWNEIRSDWRNFISNIQQKYRRRIERLFAAFTGDQKVVLIRYGLTKQNAIELRDLILYKYPKLDFVIVAVNNVRDATADWDLPNLKNYYIPDSGPDFWNGWKYIFKTIGLKKRTSKKNIKYL